MLAGAATFDITPGYPVDLAGYVRRAKAPRDLGAPLRLTSCVLRSSDATVVIVAADLLGLGVAYANDIRTAIAEAVGCEKRNVLLSSSHSHAAPAPGMRWKLGGEFMDAPTRAEVAYEAWLPSAFVAVALAADARAQPVRVAGGVGRVNGLAVNRRERAPDGRTVLGWNPDGFVDEDVPVLRIDAEDGSAVATLVVFGCHPVVLAAEVAKAGPDFVGPLRDTVERLRGGVCLFLQGSAGNVLPLQAFHDHEGPEVGMGERLGFEAVHAVIDADPRVSSVEKLGGYGSVTPISLYRRRISAEQPEQALAVASRIVALPLLAPPTVAELDAELAVRVADLDQAVAQGDPASYTNTITYHVAWLRHTIAELRARRSPSSLEGEIWAARIGDCAIVAAPGEIFGEIGSAVRMASPAAVTLFTGYANGVLGYVATPAEYPFGGYEPAVSHRGYGHPAPFKPEVAGAIRTTALELLAVLFPERALTAGHDSSTDST